MSASPSTAGERSFACPEDGCGKSFLRSEHLARHRLNHRPTKIYSCSRCPKEFVRPDLYQRHKDRHDKGMWYRQVGGVVEKAALRSQNHDRPIHRVGKASSSSLLSQNTEPEGLAQAESNTLNAASFTDSDIPFGGLSGCKSTHPGYEHHRNQGFFNNISAEGGETLFFDDSTNPQDLPDDLDWFFEASQPVLVPPIIMGVTGGNSGPYEPIPAIPEIQPSDHQSASAEIPSTPEFDNSWSIARSKILLSLQSLSPEILQSRFFEPSNLSLFYDLYFKNYHHHFPILHQPSISITEAPPLLLTAILTLGATLAVDTSLYFIGQKIHDALRWVILSTGKFEPPSPLWCLQALLLVQAQGKMFSSSKHHEMAHIFHGAILTMMKRGRAYSTISSFGDSQSTSLEISWRQWAEDESSRRTAFFAFLMDAQHASVFGHTPVLSVSDMRLPLPCSNALWESVDPSTWDALMQQTPKASQFLPTLKALLGKSFVPSTCSDFSRFILLHGLLSLTSHLQARDTTTLGIGIKKTSPRESPTLPVSKVEDWEDIMSMAIETWSFSLLSLEQSLCLEAAKPLHRMAYITLHSSITDFHIIAKDTTLIDNVLLQKEFFKAKSRLSEWSQTDEAKKAVNHALLLVKETVFTGKRYRAREDNIALRPWCLYHAVLVLWAYGLMTEGESDEALGLIGAEEYVVNMLSGLQRNTGSISGANRTNGLISAMADALENCRWELLEEAYLTLRRLSGINIGHDYSKY